MSTRAFCYPIPSYPYFVGARSPRPGLSSNDSFEGNEKATNRGSNPCLTYAWQPDLFPQKVFLQDRMAWEVVFGQPGTKRNFFGGNNLGPRDSFLPPQKTNGPGGCFEKLIKQLPHRPSFNLEHLNSIQSRNPDANRERTLLVPGSSRRFSG